MWIISTFGLLEARPASLQHCSDVRLRGEEEDRRRSALASFPLQGEKTGKREEGKSGRGARRAAAAAAGVF